MCWWNYSRRMTRRWRMWSGCEIDCGKIKSSYPSAILLNPGSQTSGDEAGTPLHQVVENGCSVLLQSKQSQIRAEKEDNQNALPGHISTLLIWLECNYYGVCPVSCSKLTENTSWIISLKLWAFSVAISTVWALNLTSCRRGELANSLASPRRLVAVHNHKGLVNWLMSDNLSIANNWVQQTKESW